MVYRAVPCPCLSLVSTVLSHVAISGLSCCSMSLSVTGFHRVVPCSYKWSIVLFHVPICHWSPPRCPMALFVTGLRHAGLGPCSYHWSITLFHVSYLVFMTLSHVAVTGLSRCSMSISGLHDTIPCSYHWSITLFHVSMTLSHVSVTGLSRWSCPYLWSP